MVACFAWHGFALHDIARFRSDRQRLIDEIPGWLAAHHPTLVKPADERRAQLDAMAAMCTHRLHAALNERQLQLCRSAMHAVLRTSVGDKAESSALPLDKIASDVCAQQLHGTTAKVGTGAVPAAEAAVWDDVGGGGLQTFCTVTLARFIGDGEADAAQVRNALSTLGCRHALT